MALDALSLSALKAHSLCESFCSFLMFQMLDIIYSFALFEIRMHHNQCDHHNKAAVLE